MKEFFNNRKNLILIFAGVFSISLLIASVSYLVILSGGRKATPAYKFEDVCKAETIFEDNEKMLPPFNSEIRDGESFLKMSEFVRNENLKLYEWMIKSVPLYTKNENEIEIEYTPRVSYYYLDFETGNSFFCGEDEVFFSASTIKEPYILYVLKEIENAEKGEIEEDSIYDVNRNFEYTQDKFVDGSGVIKNEEYGTLYTYFDLLNLSITKSDNIAFKEIRSSFGNSGFKKYSDSLGAINPQKKFYSISASDAIKYLADTYAFFKTNTKYSNILKNWMLSTNHRIMIPGALKPTPVANKYGWDNEAYHDMAIVFDDHPYAMVILTELDLGTKEDNSFIRTLASKINEIHIKCASYR